MSQEFVDKWTRVVQAQSSRNVQPGNRVDYLIDGWATFESMYQAIKTTLSGDGAGYYIYCLGWWLDEDFLMNTPESDSGKQADPHSTFYQLMSRAATSRYVQVRVLLYRNWFKLGVYRQVSKLNKLPLTAAVVDDNLYLQSHHQKVLIVKGSEGLIGFCGGIDIAKDRVQPLYKPTGSPLHDVHCRIQGNAANCLLQDGAQEIGLKGEWTQ